MLTHFGLDTLGDDEELLIGERHDRIRRSRRGPDHLVLCQRCVDDRAQSLGCPVGATPPMTWPVALRTSCGLALVISPAPMLRARMSVSTRAAPLAITSSGSPSHSNTRLLAMAPTAQPNCSAAAAAVLASAARIVTAGLMPAAATASATRALRSFTPQP